MTDRRYTESRDRVDREVEALARLAHEFHTGVISEPVYLASMKKYKVIGEAARVEVRLHAPPPRRVMKEKYRLENGKVVLNV